MKKVIFAACLSLFAFTATAANKPCSGKKGDISLFRRKVRLQRWFDQQVEKDLSLMACRKCDCYPSGVADE